MWVLFTAVVLAMAAIQTAPWPFRLEWEHDGLAVSQFQLCVDGGDCSALAATRVASDTWSAPLPLLSQGFHTLTVNACNGSLCTPGTPTLSVNVRPSGPDVVGSPPSAPPATPSPQAPGNRAPPRHPPKA
jgi:hypothetical protein